MSFATRCLVLLSFLLPSLAFSARPLSHFPVQVDGAVQGAVALFDLTGDGRAEAVASAGEFVTALRADNSLLPGFPVFIGSAAVGSPAVADILGRGEKAILVVTRAGQVHLIRPDGASWPGFPVSLGEGARAGGALLDVTGDGKREVVAGGVDGRLHVWRVTPQGPGLLPGFPIAVGAELTSVPAIGDLGGPSAPERTILVGAADGGLHAFDSEGRARRGFPVRTRFLISGSAAVGDIDDDGVADVVFASQDYRLFAVDAAGRTLPGFPIETGYRIHAGPALADLTGDGVPEIVFASSDRKLYAVDREARALSGFPVTLSANPVGGVAVADLHRSGEETLVVATEDRLLHAFDRTGASLDGWPISLEGPPSSAPTLADFTGDGYVEIVLGTRDARIVAMKARRRGEAPWRPAWPTEGHDPGRSGWRHPNSARFRHLSVAPVRPRSTDTMEPVWTFRHLDRLPEGEVELRWYRDGEEVEELRGERRVAPSHVRKGQRWRFAVSSIDDGPQALAFQSPDIEIRNAPPTQPMVRILPERPTIGVSLLADLVEGSTDPDDDPVSYLYRWFRDELPVELPEDSSAVPPGMVRKSETWRVEVRPFDGLERGPLAEASATILNTPPTRPAISLSPAVPRVTDEVRVVIDTSPVDADGDSIANRHRWRVDGVATSLDDSVRALPPGFARKGQVISLELAAFDGEAEGPTAEASATVVNTPPSAPSVVIEPELARTGDALRAAIRSPSRDPDGDPLRHTFKWLLDGEDAEVEVDHVPGERVRAGRRWTILVRAHDDDGPGGEARAEIRIVNTPPTPPVVAIVPEDPLPEQPLEAKILLPASDRDGDSVRLTYSFTAPGRQRVGEDRVGGGVTRKGEVWTLTVTPHDGAESGVPAVASVRIGNRPPPTPTVRIEPRTPVGGTDLRAVAPLPVDPDGDQVRLRLRWMVDGVPVPELDDRMQVPGLRVTRDQVWRVAVSATDGEAWSGVTSDTVRIDRRPPRPPRVRVTPPEPTSPQPLRCEVETPAAHPDQDPIEVSLLWYREGSPTSFVGETLSSEATRRGDRLSCAGMVVAASGTVLGERSAEAVVVNSAPTQPEVRISPASPVRNDPLSCALARPSLDADGDELSYSWSWLKDGAATDLVGPTVPENRVRRGERWTCRVVPSDPHQQGPTAESTTEIGNTPPSAPEVAILPATPAAGDDLECRIVSPSIDPDGGEVSYQFRWYLNGVLQPFAPTSTAVRGRLVEAGGAWRCGATPHDSLDEGREGRSLEVEVAQREPEQSSTGGPGR